jgi:hypothetical protein
MKLGLSNKRPNFGTSDTKLQMYRPGAIRSWVEDVTDTPPGPTFPSFMNGAVYLQCDSGALRADAA